jgi:hypothetical protein
MFRLKLFLELEQMEMDQWIQTVIHSLTPHLHDPMIQWVLEFLICPRCGSIMYQPSCLCLHVSMNQYNLEWRSHTPPTPPAPPTSGTLESPF